MKKNRLTDAERTGVWQYPGRPTDVEEGGNVILSNTAQVNISRANILTEPKINGANKTQELN